jgi:hypothetical protein
MLTYAGVESSLDEFEKMLLEMDGEPLAAAGSHVRIRQHASAYVSMRQHTSAY